MVTIEEFSKIELRIGKIVEVEDLEGARKPVYAMKVDLGELGIRSIAAGIKDVYSKDQLLGKYVVVVANLDQKRIANFVSEGMVLAAEDESGISLLGPDKELRPGSRVR